MSEAAPIGAVRVTVSKVDIGALEGGNRITQLVGGGVTFPLNFESPLENVLQLNNNQIAGLFGYIGLLNAGIDTTAIETAVATLVAAS